MDHCQLLLIGFLKFLQKTQSAENNIWKIKQHGQVSRWLSLYEEISKEIRRQLQGHILGSAQCTCIPLFETVKQASAWESLQTALWGTSY